MAIYSADVAIIGAGPSGLFMVFEAGFLGYSCVVADALPHVGGQLTALYPEKPIYDVPAQPSILAGELIDKLQAQVAPFQPVYVLGEPVTALEGQVGAFTLRTAQHTLHARVVIVAGGGGMFTPRKPSHLENLHLFEASGDVRYAVTQKAQLAGHHLVLAGGGDSAVDWAVELASVAAHVHVVHRRADFKAAAATVSKMYELEKECKITVHVPFQLAALAGEDGSLRAVTIADMDGVTKVLPATRLLCCFGLAPQAAEMATWGIGLEKGLVAVDHTTMQTQRPGVLCIGDMAAYDGKIPLIVTGFAEAAVAAKTVQALINPERKFKVQYSTSKGVPRLA